MQTGISRPTRPVVEVVRRYSCSFYLVFTPVVDTTPSYDLDLTESAEGESGQRLNCSPPDRKIKDTGIVEKMMALSNWLFQREYLSNSIT